MTNLYKPSLSKTLMAGTCLSILAAISVLPAHAQTASQSAAAEEDVTTVVVVGTRAAQQSAIDRKKRATTQTDSIIADDVGAFPDRNLNEAISRISGVSLERDEFGEGAGISIRGNGPDLTRVEIDGLGVQSGSGGLAESGSEADGRGADMRELPSDLIKSVDVVKGSTAEMTEGSLGGGVQIETRTGLDFKKPYLSLNVAGSRNSLGKQVTPYIGLVASGKMFDSRLGVLFSVTSNKIQNTGHNIEAVNPNQGYIRTVDWDNSPEKTFSYNPGTYYGDPTIDKPHSSSQFMTPQLLELMAQAQTKEECSTLINGAKPLASNASNTQKTVRHREILSCLNQWNDYHPGLMRYTVNENKEDRLSADIRFDFRVNNRLSVYTKFAIANRDVVSSGRTLRVGGTPSSDGSIVTNTIAGQGYPTFNTGYITSDSATPTTTLNTNVKPDSVAVDANHHLTQFTTENTTAHLAQFLTLRSSETSYAQFGGNYRQGPLNVKFLAGVSKSDYVSERMSVSRAYNVGDVAFEMTDGGMWNFDIPAGLDTTNPENYLVLSNGDTGFTNSFGLNYTPQIQENDEKTLKVDATYRLPEALPFFRAFKAGVNLRDTKILYWRNGGYTPEPGVSVPSQALRGSFRACEGPTCQYGYVPSTGNPLFGVDTFTQAELSQILSSTFTPANFQFFDGYADDLGLTLGGWGGTDIKKLLGYLEGAQNFNLDCIRFCAGTNGEVYEQPRTGVEERVTAAYYMLEFDQDLMLGMRFNGNFGVRMVETDVTGRGMMTLDFITLNDPNNPLGSTTTTRFSTNTSIEKSSRDWLPSYNVNLWFTDDIVLRYNTAKTVARPRVGQLIASGTCILDERTTEQYGEVPYDDDDGVANNCSQRVGNPELKPYTAKNQTASLEWYVNKDTNLSFAVYELDVRIGRPITTTASDLKLFEGSDTTHPVTGIPLGEYEFTRVPTYMNGPGYLRRGWEIGGKTAFSFLPSYLRYTGLDANYSKLKTGGNSVIDPNSGDAMRPPQEPSYTANLSLWYDDGKTNARISYQAKGEEFISITSGSGIATYPGNFGITPATVTWNPGQPRFNLETEYVDAKISHRFNSNVEMYLEGRNLTRKGAKIGGGDYNGFENVENIWKLSYGGARVTMGVKYTIK